MHRRRRVVHAPGQRRRITAYACVWGRSRVLDLGDVDSAASIERAGAHRTRPEGVVVRDFWAGSRESLFFCLAQTRGRPIVY